MLARAGLALGDGLLRAYVVPGGEQRARPAQDDHPDGVVGLGRQEGVAQLDQQPAALRVARPGPVQRDPGDRPLVEGLVLDELEFLHRVAFLSLARLGTTGSW